MSYGIKSPKPSKEAWLKLCPVMSRRAITRHFGIGYERANKLSEEYGMRPSRRCNRCGLKPYEYFKEGKDRLCIDCQNQPKTNRQDIHQATHQELINGNTHSWTFEWAKKPWGVRLDGISNGRVQAWQALNEPPQT
jgi:hypothetical protein